MVELIARVCCEHGCGGRSSISVRLEARCVGRGRLAKVWIVEVCLPEVMLEDIWRGGLWRCRITVQELWVDAVAVGVVGAGAGRVVVESSRIVIAGRVELSDEAQTIEPIIAAGRLLPLVLKRWGLMEGRRDDVARHRF